ncbi:hypothetical protein [Streptomyces sp. B6B3]|uniref:hypothetical protein n=1 Tax=Streptomyces sp. B6B3 TaxID=3153570 RepID=UPI00325C68D5
MNTEQGERRVPPPPVAPPKPAAPPRPATPPRPGAPLESERTPGPAAKSTATAAAPPRRPAPAAASPTPATPPRPTAPPRRTVEVLAPPRPATPPRPAGSPDPAAGRADGPGALDDDASPPTLLLRPIGARRRTARLVAPVACLVLGTGLLGGAAAGAWLTDDTDRGATSQAAFEEARSLWRDVPVDQLFPRQLTGREAGPGGSDRLWNRIAVAPDAGCGEAFDTLLAETLAAVGCERLVRATYVDETETSVTTVGLLFTRGEAADMRALHDRFDVEALEQRPDLIPGAYGPAGTLAEDFGDEQRAAWTVRVLGDLPVVVYAVTGFVDGRTITDPQPAAEATEEGQDSTVALAGLGHDAEGIADRVQAGLRDAADGADGEETP